MCGLRVNRDVLNTILGVDPLFHNCAGTSCLSTTPLNCTIDTRPVGVMVEP
jgi:hypothetical protein